MISRILIKKIKKHGFGKKDSFTIIDVAPKEYYKLVKIDKLYFAKIVLGFRKILENIKPHDTIVETMPDGTLCKTMVGNEFVLSLSDLIKIADSLYFPPNSNKENEENYKYYNILHKIIQTVQKHGYHNRVIFVLEKN
ncbi:MAG: hypothetical protein [Bacteriophage sp.]|nr:MAG: hypothetical protein [Bacteriophage sp.]